MTALTCDCRVIRFTLAVLCYVLLWMRGFFNGIRARLNNGDGIYIDATSYIVLDGGEAISNGRIAGSSGRAGVRAQGEVTIENMHFWNEPGLELQQYGIAMPLSSPGNMVRIRKGPRIPHC